MLKILINNTENKQGKFPYYFGMVSALFLVAGFVLAYIQPGTIMTDGGIFTAVALKDLENGTLYVNAWENKPPGIFYLLKCFIFIFPDNVFGVFIMVFALFLLSAACIFHLQFNYLNSLTASLLLTGLALFWMVHRDTIGDGIYTEIPGTLCILIAMVFAEKYRSGAGRYNAFYAGIAMGFSFWFKEPFIIMCLPLSGLIFTAENPKNPVHKGMFAISVLLPSLLFTGLLYFQGSLQGFTEMLKYNFNYISAENTIDRKSKLNNLYVELIRPNAGLFILLAFSVLKVIQLPDKAKSAVIYLCILVFSGLFILISPYNFGHYNYTLYTLFVPLIAAFYNLLNKASGIGFKLPLILISLYTLYNIDEKLEPKWKLQVEPYTEDRFTQILKKDQNKTLFVDYTDAGSYYLKSGLLFKTYIPVPLPVHTGNNASGIKNRERILESLQNDRPDYLITANPPSEFAWNYPGFYNRYFTLKDSLDYKPDKRIYLWEKTLK